MAVTVRDLMTTFSPQSLDVDNEFALSSKPWTREFAEFDQRYVTRWQPTIEAIEEFLGPANDTPSSTDFIGLQTPANHLNTFPQLISSEGDVTHDFDQNITPLIALAFSGKSALTSSPLPNSAPQPGAPILWSRSLVGPTGSASSTKTVDYQMTMRHLEPSLELAAMIGEMKAPRVIKTNEWLFERAASSTTNRLQQELRAYAYEYHCPQVFVFDTKNLVIVQFRASNAEDIANEDCPIDCCVIPRRIDPYITNQCTMQYALYRLAWRGWIRLCATLESKTSGGQLIRSRKSLSLDGFIRQYEYWSGRPVWVDEHHHQYQHHPSGYRREFVYRHSQRRDGTVKTGGLWIWKRGREIYDDTSNCFL